MILRSGNITLRNPPTAGRCGRVRSLVTSDGMGGTAGRGGAAPFADGSGQVVEGPGSGLGVAGSGMVSFPWEVGADGEW
jgi:hypothetical protein